MRFHLLLCLLVALPLFGGETDDKTVETEEFQSPKKGAVVVIQNLNILEHRSNGVFTTPSQVVSVIDAHSLKCVFAFKTHQRYTRAFWNRQGTRCLILDSPDDGNTFLYLLSKAGTDWNELSLDPIMDDLDKNFEKEKAEGALKKGIDLYRGGPTEDGIKWDSDENLEIKTHDATGYNLFRIAVAPDGKSFSRIMTFLGK